MFSFVESKLDLINVLSVSKLSCSLSLTSLTVVSNLALSLATDSLSLATLSCNSATIFYWTTIGFATLSLRIVENR
jgi:hypothetical protein